MINSEKLREILARLDCGPDGKTRTPSGAAFLASFVIYACEHEMIEIIDKDALNALIQAFPKNASALAQFFDRKTTRQVDDLLSALEN